MNDARVVSGLSDRFWSKVDIRSADQCWMWLRPLDRDGYGQFWMDGTSRRAHRVACEIQSGERVHDGLVIDHVCRNRACVNPNHLRAVTNRDNLLAPGSLTFQAKNASKTHCPKGHPYSGANLKVKKCGRRRCRACTREDARARRSRRLP